jgi:hypothetical protein
MSIFRCLRRSTGSVQAQRFVKHFVNTLSFHEDVSAPRPTHKLEDHPLIAVMHYLFNTFAATLRIWRSSPPSTTWGWDMRWWQGPTYHDCNSNNSITGWKVQQATQHANIWYTVTVFYITFVREGKMNQSTRAALKNCPRICAANVLKKLVRGRLN